MENFDSRGLKPGRADVVLEGVARVLAFQFLDLLVDDELLGRVHLLHAQDHDVGGELDHLAEAVRCFDVGETLLRGPDHQIHAGKQRQPHKQPPIDFSWNGPPKAQGWQPVGI